MSLIPLMLSHYNLDTAIASWLASSFYAGLLVGALSIEPLVTRVGYKHGFALCLGILVLTIAVKRITNTLQFCTLGIMEIVIGRWD